VSFVPGNVYVVTSTQCDSWPGCRAEHNKGLTGLMPPPRVWRHSGYGWCNAMSLGAQMRMATMPRRLYRRQPSGLLL
jgi:hypothetical protein